MRALLALALLAAGCIAPEATPTPRAVDTAFFGGSFTREYTQDDVAAVCWVLYADRSTCELGMSEAPHYGHSFAGLAACEAAREKVLAVPHTAGVEACRVVSRV